MTPFVTLWAAFILATGVIAWFGTRKQAIAYLAVAVATGLIPAATLGYPTSRIPDGELQVLGARIDEGKAIYVLVNQPDEPRYLVLPYSEQTAGQLQHALDGAADGEGTVSMRMGEGGLQFAEVVPPPEPPKQAERALIRN